MDNILKAETLFSESLVYTLITELYEQVKHGDEEHQKWLKEEIENFLKEKNIEQSL